VDKSSNWLQSLTPFENVVNFFFGNQFVNDFGFEVRQAAAASSSWVAISRLSILPISARVKAMDKSMTF